MAVEIDHLQRAQRAKSNDVVESDSDGKQKTLQEHVLLERAFFGRGQSNLKFRPLGYESQPQKV